jgi:hypothetical protein
VKRTRSQPDPARSGGPGAAPRRHDGSESAAPDGIARRWSLSRLAPLLALLAVAAVYAASHMDIGVDTWVSLAGGRHVLAHGVTLDDPFSFDSRQPPPPAGGALARLAAWLHPTGWINQNWLTHVLLAWLAGSFGLSALAAWKLLTYALVAALLLVNARLRRAEPILAVALAAGALLASRQFFEVRAQDVTNLLAVVLMLLLTAAVLRAPRVAWLVVPLFAIWGNVHGGFIWGLLALAQFAAAGAVSARLGGRVLAVPPPTLRLLAIAAAGALVAVVAASPYRLANLTHPLVISVSSDAREWRGVFEWMPLARGTAGEKAAFVGSALAALLAAGLVLRRPAPPRGSRPGGKTANADPTRALDLGSAAILLVTTAMAVTSRRFLPMAYLVGAPLVAQWLTAAGERLFAGRPTAAAPDPAGMRRLLLPAAWLAVAAVAAACLVPLSRTYRGPWPFDDRHDSIGDRLLLTAGEPWGACRFVTLNGLQGRLWNFWEAGGFWSWCQPADPVTGRVAAQVAIDGRAQAAFDIGVYRWHDLLEYGGPQGMAADRDGRQPGAAELAAIREWVSHRLTADGIWMAHVAQRNLDTPLARALLTLPGWQVVYVDANHFLFVDDATPQGHAVVARVDGGAAAFPDEVSALLTRAFRASRAGLPDGPTRVLALARQAWALKPTTRAAGLAALAASDASCADAGASFLQEIVDDQLRLGAQHAREPGYYERLVGAVTAARFLEQSAGARGDLEARKRAAGQRIWLAQEADRAAALSEW